MRKEALLGLGTCGLAILWLPTAPSPLGAG
jgi:hypothetical protein